MTGVEAVLLDAGGVLLDLDYGYLRRLVNARNHDIPEHDLSQAEALARREVNRDVREGGNVSSLWREYFHTILGTVGIQATEHEAIIDSLWDAHQRVGLWTTAIDGARETVVELKRRGFRLGVVSNAEGRVARDLDNAGFDGMFETVVDSHLVGVQKPDPEIFRIALDRMARKGKLAVESVVFVGDVPAVDVVGATAAGLAPVLVDRHDLYVDIQAPRLRSVSELIGLLDGAQEPGSA